MRVLYYVLLIIVLTAISLAGLLLMVKKFYWGPSGRPPQFRPHGGQLRPDTEAAPPAPTREATRK
jgi:hypothetical protein